MARKENNDFFTQVGKQLAGEFNFVQATEKGGLKLYFEAHQWFSRNPLQPEWEEIQSTQEIQIREVEIKGNLALLVTTDLIGEGRVAADLFHCRGFRKLFGESSTRPYFDIFKEEWGGYVRGLAPRERPQTGFGRKLIEGLEGIDEGLLRRLKRGLRLNFLPVDELIEKREERDRSQTDVVWGWVLTPELASDLATAGAHWYFGENKDESKAWGLLLQYLVIEATKAVSRTHDVAGFFHYNFTTWRLPPLVYGDLQKMWQLLGEEGWSPDEITQPVFRMIIMDEHPWYQAHSRQAIEAAAAEGNSAAIWLRRDSRLSNPHFCDPLVVDLYKSGDVLTGKFGKDCVADIGSDVYATQVWQGGNCRVILESDKYSRSEISKGELSRLNRRLAEFLHQSGMEPPAWVDLRLSSLSQREKVKAPRLILGMDTVLTSDYLRQQCRENDLEPAEVISWVFQAAFDELVALYKLTQEFFGN